MEPSSNNPYLDELRHIDSFLPKNLFSEQKQAYVTLNDAIKDGYIRFLNQWEWQWYYTLTFTDDVHPEQANKLFHRWINKMSRKIFGSKHAKRGQYIDWIRSTEYQKRGVIHYHGLLNATDKFNQFEAMRIWEDLDGKFMEEGKTGMARIFLAEQPAAEIYITKYVTKEMNIEISDYLSAVSNKESKENYQLRS